MRRRREVTDEEQDDAENEEDTAPMPADEDWVGRIDVAGGGCPC